MRFVDEIELSGKRVLLRVDLNVPLTSRGTVADDTRIERVLPTITHCLKAGARLAICSHLGRPKGKVVPEMSLAPAAKRLGELLNKDVALAPDCVGPDVQQMVNGLEPGELVILENLRFHEGETKNDPGFAKELAALADVYINDGFAVSHRAHASVTGVTEHVAECAGGFLLRQELEFFHRALKEPARPLVAILGGAKVSTKLPVIRTLLTKVDALLIGGSMAHTFLKARGLNMQASRVEDDLLVEAETLIDDAKNVGVKLVLPEDVVAADRFEAGAQTRTVPASEMPQGWMGVDIGAQSVKLFEDEIAAAATLVWNGPVGAFETPGFERGTMAVAKAVAECPGLTVAGGGDTVAALSQAGVSGHISFISTGGGAFLELMEGTPLPGVEALKGCGGD